MKKMTSIARESKVMHSARVFKLSKQYGQPEFDKVNEFLYMAEM